jgi:hypothetical protein
MLIYFINNISILILMATCIIGISLWWNFVTRLKWLVKRNRLKHTPCHLPRDVIHMFILARATHTPNKLQPYRRYCSQKVIIHKLISFVPKHGKGTVEKISQSTTQLRRDGSFGYSLEQSGLLSSLLTQGRRNPSWHCFFFKTKSLFTLSWTTQSVTTSSIVNATVVW